MLNNLEDFLDFAEISYKILGNQKYSIEIEGGSQLILKKEANKILFEFHEYGGDRIIKITINYITEEEEEILAEFIKVLVEFLNETEGEFFNYSNEKLKFQLNSRLKQIFNHYKIDIIGENPALNFGLIEKPLTKEEILEEIEKSLKRNDKEAYYKYQQMFNDLKENYSFKYLNTFKNFEK